MEAVVKIGGKQYRVAQGQQLTVDRLETEAGKTVTFEDVLMLTDGDKATIGTPLVAGAKVEARVLRQSRGAKLLVFKYKAKKRYRRIHGHRSALSVLEVLSVAGPGAVRTRAPKAAATEDKPVVEEPPAAEETEEKNDGA